jgi:hypothetical protein
MQNSSLRRIKEAGCNGEYLNSDKRSVEHWFNPHLRVLNAFRQWSIHIDELFFMGGINKAGILEAFQPPYPF